MKFFGELVIGRLQIMNSRREANKESTENCLITVNLDISWNTKADWSKIYNIFHTIVSML